MKHIVEKCKENHLLFILGLAIIGLFIVLVLRISYAYLAPWFGGDEIKEVRMETDTVDDLNFSVGNPLSITATPTTLPSGGSNLVSETTAGATLLANTATDSATYTYYVYAIITNDFVYSSGTTPEIVLTITNPSNSIVTGVTGLTYGTYNSISGFDITTKSGTYLLATQAITANSTTTTSQDWKFKVTFLNQSYDQSANFGHNLNIEILLTMNKK